MNGFDSFSDFLAAVDRDGAIAEASERVSLGRRRFLAVTIAGAGTAFLAGAAAGQAAGGGLSRSDISILNYALVLEYLQAAFYTEAERRGALTGKTAEAARVVGAVDLSQTARIASGEAATV